MIVTGNSRVDFPEWTIAPVLNMEVTVRSLLGHEDSVTAVRFQPETHYFFSASKDGVVKYWDADRFEQILNLPGHFSCVWSLDIPMDGSFCVSGSQDRSLRVWKRSEDLVFIEEEKERAFEAQADTTATRDLSTGSCFPF